MRSLVWFREDLRLTDNTALQQACDYADQGVLAVYVIDVQLWQQHSMAACRVDFILRGLQKLSRTLSQHNIALLILHLQNSTELTARLLALTQQYAIDAVFFNQQYEYNEMQRDTKVREVLEANHLQVFSYHDQTIFPPGTILTQQETTFTVFTPFKNAWLRRWSVSGCEVLSLPKKPRQLLEKPDPVPLQLKEFVATISASLWPAGEQAAQQRLENFIANNISDYAEQRDFPAKEGTSKLSPYLATGMLSPRQCLQAVLMFNRGELIGSSKGVAIWVSEIIWREFYKHILAAFPRVSKHQPFKLNTQKIAWQYNSEQVQAWQQGQTGYPFVDAGMRQLLQTGWMHNRLRMVTAMFFSKTLFLDWRIGEQHFMQHLIDGDLAANNGGWQWSASTGTDAVPYFRIFNPVLQSKRFDPEGKFIRQYCKELAHLDNKSIHQPYAENSLWMQNIDYPQPIVSHASNKDKVIAAFKSIKT